MTSTESMDVLPARVAAYAMASADLFAAESDFISQGRGLPKLTGVFKDAIVLVVADAPKKSGRESLRRFVATRPVQVVAVGARGLAACRELRLKARVVVGDPTPGELDGARRASEVVLPMRPDGDAPGSDLLRSESIHSSIVQTALSELDVALLLAAKNGARALVVQAREFGLAALATSGANSFNAHLLVLAEVEPLLVSAAALAAVERPAPSAWLVLLVLLAALVTFACAVWLTPWGQALLPMASGAFEPLFTT